MAALEVALIPFRLGSVADAAGPLKLFEYLALRRPVVSTPTAEIRRLSSDWVFIAPTVGEWADLINGIL